MPLVGPPRAALWRAALWRAALVASLFGAPIAGAWGQSREDGPTPRAYRQVAQVCPTEYRRLCPSADLAVPRPRAMVMCLKPYKTSLSLGCRRAVNAVSP